MRIILILFIVFSPLVVKAQRMELITLDRECKYVGMYAYGLPRDVVRTNSEMREAMSNDDGTGLTKRHHVTKGEENDIGNDGDKGEEVNKKISFAFVVAPYNTTLYGDNDLTGEVLLTWSEASGWDSSIDTETPGFVFGSSGPANGESVAASPVTGCAAYKGIDGLDEPGTWRLPTQREVQTMFTVIEQAIDEIVGGHVVHQIDTGDLWTSSEFCVTGDTWEAWYLNNLTGFTKHTLRGATDKKMARCIKDIYLPINEINE